LVVDAQVVASFVDIEGTGFISSIVVLATAFVLGDNLRQRREAADLVQEQLDRAERERELIAHQRATEERARIARELHDAVAHSVSAMVIHAAAARRSIVSSPANAEIALTNIESTGRQTMNELRGVLGVLRLTTGDDAGSGEGNRAPQPTLAAIPDLIEAASDLPIELMINGEFGDVSQSTDLTGYGIVQEAITNIRRHAGPVTRVDTIRVMLVDDHAMVRTGFRVILEGQTRHDRGWRGKHRSRGRRDGRQGPTRGDPDGRPDARYGRHRGLHADLREPRSGLVIPGK
jgi:signal transduction histidine kinase